MPPGSRACSAASPRTSCIDARFFELASVNNSVPCSKVEGREHEFLADAQLLIRRAPAQTAGDHQVQDEEQIVGKREHDALADPARGLERSAR